MKIAYFDCSSGISGDMILSALVNSGIDPQIFKSELKTKLLLKKGINWDIQIKEVTLDHFQATKTEVTDVRYFSSFDDIRNTIIKSRFKDTIKQNSLKILSLLCDAESFVHKQKHVKVHELGSIDTVVDIVGACLGLELLGIKKVYSSELNIGTLAPATLWILKTRKVPVYSTDIKSELVTPTGAAIISALSEEFGNLPTLKIERYGFGAGNYKLCSGQNDVLKIIIGEQKNSYKEEDLIILETNIDDMDTRVYPYIIDKLFSSGALDVWLTNVIMKKGRPGFVLNVLTESENEQKLIDIIFKETTTLGIRKQIVTRYKLDRYKKGRYKIGLLPDGTKKYQTEFDTVVNKLKQKNNISLYKELRKIQ